MHVSYSFGACDYIEYVHNFFQSVYDIIWATGLSYIYSQ